jgi:hypothetical protein
MIDAKVATKKDIEAISKEVDTLIFEIYKLNANKEISGYAD